jgi:uncharacterized protein YbjQ (UPF0145 family)
MLVGCGPTWSTGGIKQSGAGRLPTDATKVIVTEGDITDRPYDVLGEVEATVNKTTIFHPDPTRELVAKELKERAAGIGADAVIQVRYGTVGVGVMSWGSLGGRGRAVAFK